MYEEVRVSRLKGFSVVFENDLYAFASFLLKMHAAQDTPTCKSRTTVHGLVSEYHRLAKFDAKRVEKMLAARGIPLGASVVEDSSV